MEFVWDPPKRKQNFDRHGYDFADAPFFEWERAHVSPTNPSVRGTPRMSATGRFGDEIVTIIFTPLGTEAYSIISFRPASKKERRVYEQDH
jgi:uncharacterized DUF497 family protein